MTKFDVLVAEAALNHGVVTTDRASELGVHRTALYEWARAHRLRHVGHGVFRVPGIPAGRLGTFAEAVAWTGGRGAVSHSSALDLMELCDVLPRRIHVTVPESYNPRKAGGEGYRVHRHDLPERDLTVWEGVPVVTAFRAIRQALRAGEDREQLRMATRQATRLGLLTRSEAARCWAALR